MESTEGKLLVLVLDDDKTDGELYFRTLSEICCVMHACTVKEAEDLYKRYDGKFSVIFVDGDLKGGGEPCDFVVQIAESFQGLLVAASYNDKINEFLCGLGCTEKAPRKYRDAQEVINRRVLEKMLT